MEDFWLPFFFTDFGGVWRYSSLFTFSSSLAPSTWSWAMNQVSLVRAIWFQTEQWTFQSFCVPFCSWYHNQRLSNVRAQKGRRHLQPILFGAEKFRGWSGKIGPLCETNHLFLDRIIRQTTRWHNLRAYLCQTMEVTVRERLSTSLTWTNSTRFSDLWILFQFRK